MNKKKQINSGQRSARRKDFEIRFYEDILRKKPDFVSVLISLGDSYTKKGFYREGLAVDKRLVSLRPEDPIIHYNLACSLSLVGQTKQALSELKKAVLLGYDEFFYIPKDPDLKNLRKLSEFKSFFAKLEKIKPNI